MQTIAGRTTLCLMMFLAISVITGLGFGLYFLISRTRKGTQKIAKPHREDIMKFEEVEKLVWELAPHASRFSISYERDRKNPTDIVLIKCTLVITEYKYKICESKLFSGNTWDEVITKLKLYLVPPSDTIDDPPEEQA